MPRLERTLGYGKVVKESLADFQDFGVGNWLSLRQEETVDSPIAVDEGIGEQMIRNPEVDVVDFEGTGWVKMQAVVV